MRAIGLMSGTSLDGIDIAAIETDGERLSSEGPSAFHCYRADEESVLLRALADAQSLTERSARPGALAQAEAVVTALHIAAVETFVTVNRIDPASIDVIGFHGQTVLHRPRQGLTVQLGDGAALARESGIPVVYDFRAADVAAGGEGAPLVPVFHRALALELARPRPIAVLNVGGVANITWLDGEAEPIACDTGPGNALIDDLMRERTGQAQDTDGARAAAGRVDRRVLAALMDNPYFAKPAPKSLDRQDFHERVKAVPALLAMRVEDAAATLTAFTASAVAAAVPLLPRPPKTVIVAGGGVHNPTLMRMLARALAPASVVSAREVRWSADALEAQAFAFLAVRSLKGLPLTYPGTTGVSRPLTGGVLVRPEGT